MLELTGHQHISAGVSAPDFLFPFTAVYFFTFLCCHCPHQTVLSDLCSPSFPSPASFPLLVFFVATPSFPPSSPSQQAPVRFTRTAQYQEMVALWLGYIHKGLVEMPCLLLCGSVDNTAFCFFGMMLYRKLLTYSLALSELPLEWLGDTQHLAVHFPIQLSCRNKILWGNQSWQSF